jgi:hypothetical protein
VRLDIFVLLSHIYISHKGSAEINAFLRNAFLSNFWAIMRLKYVQDDFLWKKEELKLRRKLCLKKGKAASGKTWLFWFL